MRKFILELITLSIEYIPMRFYYETKWLVLTQLPSILRNNSCIQEKTNIVKLILLLSIKAKKGGFYIWL